MRHSHSSPSTSDGNEDLGQFLDERSLLLRRELQVPVALVRRCERRKNFAADPEVRAAHVRTLFRPLEAQGDPSEIVCVHRVLPTFYHPSILHVSGKTQESSGNCRQFRSEAAFCSPAKQSYTYRAAWRLPSPTSLFRCAASAWPASSEMRTLLPVCSPIKPSFCCRDFLRSLSLSETKSRFRFQHQMQSARKSLSPRMPPPDRAVISTRHQSDTSASPSRTNEISITFRLRFNVEALEWARFSWVARSCESTSIACRVRPAASIIPACTRSCVSRPALRPPSFTSLSSCAIWS